MTAADYAAFLVCFAQLARQQGGPLDEDSVKAYFDALIDLPLDVVQDAAARLAQQSGAWFPKAAQWHETATALQRVHIEPAYVPPGGRDDPWRNECEDCQDTGWKERQVAQGELRYSQAQGRMTPALYAHAVAEHCPCRGTNRTFQRRHQQPVQDEQPVTQQTAKRVLKRAGWRP